MKKFVILIALTALLFISCGSDKNINEVNQPNLSSAEKEGIFNKAKSVFVAPLPDKMPGSENDTPELISLGEKLYHDVRLSLKDNQSCNTCHDVNNAGVDKLPVSDGSVVGKIGRRNSPTVYNAGFHFAQFWDYRSPDLVDQAKGPILNPDEMGMPDEETVVAKISAIPEYKNLFPIAFKNDPNPITYQNIANAIGAFERTLISKSKFDNYLAGNQNAMNNTEIKGLHDFMETGCITCHTGSTLGGNMAQKMGLAKPYRNKDDMGRFEVTKNEAEKYMFKVASLRNVELTEPYYHDGSVNKLEDAVIEMADVNLGKNLNKDQVASITTFLKALTDDKLKKN